MTPPLAQSTVAILDLDGASESNLPFRQFNGLTLLEWSVRRLFECTLLDSIVITGAPQWRDRVLSGSLGGARWLPSINTTPLKRASEIAERTNAQWLLFVSPTCPFIDPALLDRLIATSWSNATCDYVGFFVPSNPNFSITRLGLAGEICSRQAIRDLERQFPDSTEPATALLRAADSPHQLRLVPLPVPLQSENLRFNLESIEDWDRAYACMEAIGDDVSWQRLSVIANSVC